MTFENQNARAKLRLELSEGVLVEVPLVVIVRAIQERYMLADRPEEKATADSAAPAVKDLVHWGFADFHSDDPRAMIHLVVTTRKDAVARPGSLEDVRSTLKAYVENGEDGDGAEEEA